MRRILVVDDQVHVRAAVLTVLRANGFEAVGSGDGATALRDFRASPFDLVLVDIYLPGIDGVNLIKSLRELSPNLPIIAMSGVFLSKSERTALAYVSKVPGLSDVSCLQKPFRPTQLLQAIESAIAVAA